MWILVKDFRERNFCKKIKLQTYEKFLHNKVKSSLFANPAWVRPGLGPEIHVLMRLSPKG